MGKFISFAVLRISPARTPRPPEYIGKVSLKPYSMQKKATLGWGIVFISSLLVDVGHYQFGIVFSQRLCFFWTVSFAVYLKNRLVTIRHYQRPTFICVFLNAIEV